MNGIHFSAISNVDTNVIGKHAIGIFKFIYNTYRPTYDFRVLYSCVKTHALRCDIGYNTIHHRGMHCANAILIKTLAKSIII